MLDKTRIYTPFHTPSIKRVLERIPLVRRILYGGSSKQHPFDRIYQIDTSGYVPVSKMKIDSSLAKKISPYVASQPSIIRRALSALPNVKDYTFVDLGCGKGRATIVAAEFQFSEVIGVEIDPNLAQIAHSNASLYSMWLKSTKASDNFYPSSRMIKIVEADATKFRPQGNNVVFFCYHAFGDELMSEFVENLNEDLGKTIEHCFFVYYNPVGGYHFDASRKWTRWFADNIPYDPSEIGFGPDINDSVVIWQSVHNALPDKHTNRNRKVIAEGMKAVID